MSNDSNAPSGFISLPKGGGALHGIGEKFSPDLHTGTGNFTVPIALPPGRNGFQPQLSLVYSTGNGNGIFGLGWSLSIPGVSRKTSKGVPRYDSRDAFILSGAEDLVPVDEQASTTTYRPRTEGLFARIQHHHDANKDHWEVRSKDGLVSFYGTPRPPSASLDWRDPATIVDPESARRVFAWKLTRTLDPFGNRIDYLYERDASVTDEDHHWDQLYLSEIRYADYGVPADPQFLITVRFSYERRTDPFSEYRSGFEVRTVRRCTQVAISTHAGSDTLTRSYQFIYLDQRRDFPADQLPLNGVSLLSQVKVVGHDSDRQEELPPLEFGYTRFEPDRRHFFPIVGRDLPPASLARSNYELVDLFGNGLPDILEMNGTVRYWRNLGAGRFDLPREMRVAPAGHSLTDPGVQLIDANGDGRVDLLVTADGLTGYYPLRFGGLWDRRSFQPYDTAPSFDLKDAEVRLVDLTGDGVTDAIRSGSRLECFFNHPRQGWEETRWVERQHNLEEFPDVNFSDPRVKWADMSGDGLQDIVLVYQGNVEYWPNLGYGNWGRRISMRNSPRLPYGYDPRRILVGDVDGDGLADIVYVDDTKVILWINQSGNGWSAPIEIDGTPPVSDMDAIRLADLLGAGVSGVLWSMDAGGLSRENMFFLDFTGETKPYLLNEMVNNTGAVTSVGYASSTRFYVEDQKRRETRWKTPLPFPVQVVARVEVIDAISHGKLTTEYKYHHGYWDGGEREFRGFGRVDQLDTEVFEDFHATGLHPADRQFERVSRPTFSPPTEIRTWFHQGPIGEEFGEWEETDFSNEFWSGDTQELARPRAMVDELRALPRRARRDALRTLRGQILRTELYALDGTERQHRPYTVTENIHGVREETATGSVDASRPRVFFPHPLVQRTTQWERGDDPMTQFTFTDDYDQYGQPRSQINVAVPRRRDFRRSASPAEPYLATYAITDYVRPAVAGSYIADRGARTTSYEIINDGSLSVFELRAGIVDGSAWRRLIGQTLNFYDGPAFEGLPFGQAGNFGAVVRTETLVLNEQLLHDGYKSGSDVLTPPEEPPYVSSGVPAWTTDYPPEFRSLLPTNRPVDPARPGLLITPAGYGFADGEAGSIYARGYFVATLQRRYDFHESRTGRGLPMVARDPLGHATSVVYDRYDLLPVEVTDPAGLTIRSAYDYRVLQPREVMDANGNRMAYEFTPLGLLESTTVMGKAGESLGDTLNAPSTRLVYDLLAFADPVRRQPISVRTIRRVHHANEIDPPLPQRDETIEMVEYSDGFGRLLQTRTQSEDVNFGDSVFGGDVLPADQTITPGDAVGHRREEREPSRVVVSGWQVYDNKGRVVEKYEPFFSAGWEYSLPTDSERGQRAMMYYDPRGQVIRTVNPDGSEQRIVHGVPGRIGGPDLTSPEVFAPTPWEAYTYDANQNAGRTHAAAAASYNHHWNMPGSAVVDALGRVVEAVARKGSNPATDWYVTRSTYDIRGNLLTISDALGRVAFRHTYDLANKPLRIESIDAGLRRIVRNAGGHEVERRDGKGAFILHAYDVLSHPVRLWARDGTGEALTMRGHLVYGYGMDSGLTRTQAQAANLLDKLYKHYDEAGLLTFETYDFKGNVLEKTRHVIGDPFILAVFSPAPTNWQVQTFRVDWQPPAGTTLPDHARGLCDAEEYRTSLTYDALNRVTTMRYPRDVEGERKLLRAGYNRAGTLERVELDGVSYVDHIAYNAKGVRSFIAYGNGVMTRYAYHLQTFRLTRLRTERYTKPTGSAFTYRPTAPGSPLQDFAYEYDLAGNMLAFHDRTPESGLPSQTDRLDRTFTYDPLYRLLSATGRECDLPPAAPPWQDEPRCADLTRTRSYTERYQYDPLGNITRLQHQSDSGFTREFALAPGSNRLAAVTIGTNSYGYAYDPNGNLMNETSSRHFEWDHSDRLRAYRTQTMNSEPSVHVHYFYDANGQRAKKLVRKRGGQVEVTVYVDDIFEHHHLFTPGAAETHNTLHVMDNQNRIAAVRVGPSFRDDRSPAVKYYLGDHLGSSNLVIDSAGTWTNREEYTPYGETSFGGFSKKRFRFTGKEREEESGLSYHQARYYAPWLGKWASCDPAGTVDGLNLYRYAQDNPIKYSDKTGMIGGASDPAGQGTRQFELNVQGVQSQLESLQTRLASTSIRREEALETGNAANIAQTRREWNGLQSELRNLNTTIANMDTALAGLQASVDLLNPDDRNHLTQTMGDPEARLSAAEFTHEQNRDTAERLGQMTLPRMAQPPQRLQDTILVNVPPQIAGVGETILPHTPPQMPGSEPERILPGPSELTSPEPERILPAPPELLNPRPLIFVPSRLPTDGTVMRRYPPTMNMNPIRRQPVFTEPAGRPYQTPRWMVYGGLAVFVGTALLFSGGGAAPAVAPMAAALSF